VHPNVLDAPSGRDRPLQSAKHESLRMEMAGGHSWTKREPLLWLDEASYVAKTPIPAGVDGYIVDPGPHGQVDKKTGKKLSNDWDQAELAPIARQFCATIQAGGEPQTVCVRNDLGLLHQRSI
jgi:hypothetical protein